MAGFSWKGGFGIFKNQQSQGKKSAGPYTDFQGGTGTGAGFLSSMGYGANGLAGGSTWEDRGPLAQKSFLIGEMGPGGYLSDAQTSLETAGRVNSFFDQGRSRYGSTINSAAAAGLSRRYAAPLAQQSQDETANAASDAFFASMGETNARRFQAVNSYVNAASESAWTSKQLSKQHSDYEHVQRQKDANNAVGMAGTGIGAIIKAFA